MTKKAVAFRLSIEALQALVGLQALKRQSKAVLVEDAIELYGTTAELTCQPESAPQQPLSTPEQAGNTLPLRKKGVAGCL